MRTGVIDTWGSSAEERDQPYPCDELVETADRTLFRAVTVGAPADVVFSPLCQFRAAPYSYDWIDDRGDRSPRRLDSSHTALEPDQRFANIFRLLSHVPGRSLTLRSETPFFDEVGVSYVAHPLDAASCRLVAKIVLSAPAGVWGSSLSLTPATGEISS